jgi:hypothetical protein
MARRASWRRVIEVAIRGQRVLGRRAQRRVSAIHDGGGLLLWRRCRKMMECVVETKRGSVGMRDRITAIVALLFKERDGWFRGMQRKKAKAKNPGFAQIS